MIKVSVLYPKTTTSRFDMTYYLERHVPLAQSKLGTALKSAAIDKGLGGAMPGQPAAYSVMTHLCFDSVEAFQAAFGPHAEVILGDIPNFSSEQPTIQISEVVG